VKQDQGTLDFAIWQSSARVIFRTIRDQCSASVTLPSSAVDFNKTLRSAVDETLVEVLGCNVLDVLYTTLETKYAIKRDELPRRTDVLYQTLEIALGVQGARTVGNHIAEKLYRKLEMPFNKHEGYALLDYIEVAKTKLNQGTAP